MSRAILLMILSFVCSSSFAEPADGLSKYIYQDIAAQVVDLLSKQKINNADTAMSINGRHFNIGLGLFVEITTRSFAKCNDFGRYATGDLEQQAGMSRACQQQIFSDISEWLAVSRDSSISSQAWQGASYESYSSTNPYLASINFGHWAGKARLIQSRLNEEAKVQPLYDMRSGLMSKMERLRIEIEKQETRFFTDRNKVEQMKAERDQLRKDLLEVDRQIRRSR